MKKSISISNIFLLLIIVAIALAWHVDRNNNFLSPNEYLENRIISLCEQGVGPDEFEERLGMKCEFMGLPSFGGRISELVPDVTKNDSLPDFQSEGAVMFWQLFEQCNDSGGVRYVGVKWDSNNKGRVFWALYGGFQF